MTRKEFHAAYELMPKEFRAELIGGVVYVASPLSLQHVSLQHGRAHPVLGMLFVTYCASTPGTECADNATVFLDDDSEPQPDLLLRIVPEMRGQSSTTSDDYVRGSPS